MRAASPSVSVSARVPFPRASARRRIVRSYATDAPLDDLRARWRESSYDLSIRWPLTRELYAREISRAGLSARLYRLGWHAAKSYVGITYLYDDDRTGEARGDVFLSKYVMLDPEFDNALGCVRHELAHAVAGPKSVDHGREFLDACERLDVPVAWRGEKTGAFYSRPATQLMWAKCDAEELLRKDKAGILPALLYERNVWDAPVGGDRTVFKDEETGTVLDAFEMFDLVEAETVTTGRQN